MFDKRFTNVYRRGAIMASPSSFIKKTGDESPVACLMLDADIKRLPVL